MKAFIFHCWGGDSRACWRGWLADELRNRNYEVVAPNFPNTMEPKLEEWLDETRSHVKKFNEEWVLIAHSLGCPTILHLLETFNDEKVKAVILVAGFAIDLGIPEIANFTDQDFNWEKIKKGSNKFIVINSDNDPFIELEEGKRMAKLLGAEFIVEHNGGHINEGSGFTKYPKLLELMEKLR
ncbi:alpha/beta hydrolase [Candidatus Micrarchaeota archaeon]|nr:alpha/beta hydrolase [Candidatus Micrarchaeota archaeon]